MSQCLSRLREKWLAAASKHIEVGAVPGMIVIALAGIVRRLREWLGIQRLRQGNVRVIRLIAGRFLLDHLGGRRFGDVGKAIGVCVSGRLFPDCV